MVRSTTRGEIIQISDDAVEPVVATTTNLESLTDPINTESKFQAKRVFNSTTNKPVWAVGATAASVWVDATGATVHTPV